MNKQRGKASEVLRWVAVLPGGILVGFLVLFPLHWVLYFTLVRGEMIQMPAEDVVLIERFLSPILSSIFFVFAGALMAPRRQVLVSYVLFSVSLFVRIVILRLLLSSLAGAVGIHIVPLREKAKEQSS